ncbi:endonuclease YncB(thermonuclease family) [Microbacterium keratanolyticum]|uniref:TNase-like domain-containing protein n=1 Tax=Microbacterium keratanolyticum TaxID=67574 RepID=A0A9W6HUC9_9MICO|nr:thermonuclease family protein [Microbacterium keratanolyticum]MBM7467540.1 endonuclease YncB(thermonuclease family) [Microbacterium keratanolyticum]GLK02530.1 hypothetical protein GCM10017596_22450 [Microbacterium keratanolyticum]
MTGRRGRKIRPLHILGGVLAIGLIGSIIIVTGAPSLLDRVQAVVSEQPDPHPETASAQVSATFVSVIDGDTIETSVGTVRLIGIDTPERGECGYGEASAQIGMAVTAGAPLTLTRPEGQNDRDRYDRLLRYVATEAGADLGLVQLQAGHAVARFDSRDGYPMHPNEVSYQAAQTAIRDATGVVVPLGCQAQPPPPVDAPEPIAGAAAEEGWWYQYTSCGRLKKNAAGHPVGPFSRDDPAQAAIYEWFAFGTGNKGDGDRDGLACE